MFPPLDILLLISLASFSPAAASASSTTTSNATLYLPPFGRPLFAEKLQRNLIGLSIEMDRWDSWAGDAVGKPNVYMNQMLVNLGNKTGVVPPLRIGADSEDHGFIQPEVAVINSTFPPAETGIPYPEASFIGMGRDFYALSSNLPRGTKFIWGLNLKCQNLTEVVSQAAMLADTFQGSRKALMKNVVLQSIELGNEVDGFPFSNWTPQTYVDFWKSAVLAVSKVIHIGGHGHPTLQGPALGGGNAQEWDAQSILNAGYASGPAGKLLKTFGEHQYAGVYSSSSPPRGGDLMRKDYIRDNQNRNAREVARARAYGLPFILGETNSYANHGAPGVSNAGESAIWMVDNTLQAASVGVQQLYFHHGVGYRYNLIQPVSGVDDGVGLSSRPHILPSYYGALVVNEAVGMSGKAYVSEVGTNSGQLAAYAIWEDQRLARMVLIDSEYFAPTAEYPNRRNTTVLLGGFEGYNHTSTVITAKRLFIPQTNATSGLTWGSVSYDASSGLPTGSVQLETIIDGSLVMSASEVVLLFFN